MAKAYTSVAEAKEQIFLYREALQQLLQLWPEASDTRQKWADLRAEETRNALMSLWFDILGYWLLLQPEPTSLQVMQAVWLPQLLPTPASREILPAGPPGWQFTRVQRARLAQEKADLLRRQETLRSETYAAQDLKPCSSEPLTAERALEQAGHAYTEQKPQDALCFLQQILHTGTLTPEQRRYVEMSLTYLQNPEFFDGVLGVYLLKVEATGAAAKADLQPGDVIVRYNQQLVKEPAELATLIAASHDAPSVPIEFVRNGQRLTHYVPGGTSLTALGTPLVVLWGSAL
jgi:membrane-associated protease RseP (regulator of RpoE activity)